MNWDIKACGGKCIKCNKDLADGELFNCRLFLEANGPVREDFCKECWGKREDLQKGYSMWQGIFKVEPEEPKEEPIEEPYLKHLLKKWLNSPERLHQCFCYVIALLLERSKSFSEKPRIIGPNGVEQLVYEDRDTGESYILDDPGLTINELDNIESQLQEMLKNELPGKKNP